MLTRLVGTVDVLLPIATVALVNLPKASVRRETTHKSTRVYECIASKMSRTVDDSKRKVYQDAGREKSSRTPQNEIRDHLQMKIPEPISPCSLS